MTSKQDDYVPALAYDGLTRFYDPLIAMALRENAFKSALIEQANIQNGQRVLDLACGTATMTLMIKSACPDAEVTGVDGDPKILGIARGKIERAQVELTLDEAMSFELPYEDQSFDRILSSLFFHHLTSENKTRTAAELHRILKPGGSLHVADWGKPQNLAMAGAIFTVRILDGFDITSDNVNGRLPSFFKQADFENVGLHREFATVMGTIALYSAHKPE